MDIRARSWLFTYNNPELTFDQFRSLFNGQEIVKFVGQLEKGEEEGTEHFQGVVQFTSKKSLKQLKSYDTKPHWEPCKSLKNSLEYCTKEKTRVEGPWCFGWERPRRIERISMESFNDWQRTIWNMVQGPPDRRKIIWCWEPDGEVGKTQLGRKMCLEMNALMVGGKASDIKHAVAKYVSTKELRVAIFDLPRTCEQYVSYDALESIKNGMFFSGKYDAGMCIFNVPHVIVFSNFPPEESKLSKDRWDIRFIDKETMDFTGKHRTKKVKLAPIFEALGMNETEAAESVETNPSLGWWEEETLTD